VARRQHHQHLRQWRGTRIDMVQQPMFASTPGWFAFTRDGKQLAYATNAGTVCLWDLEAGQDVLTLDDFPTPAVRLFFSGDGRRLFAVDHQPRWHVWDATPPGPGRARP
jgi:WD40 repeat protein